MACDSGSWDDDNRVASYKAEADAAARAACEMAKAIRDRDAKMPSGNKGIPMFRRLSRETKDWIRNHDVIDKKRLAREEKKKKKAALRKRALSKLTTEEIEILNISVSALELAGESDDEEED